MSKGIFNTLFSRMLSTYLAIVLLVVVLLGITIGAMFKNQYIGKTEYELRREAEEINRVIVTQYIDGEKRSVAKDSLLTTMRKYDAMLQLYFKDSAYGKVIFRDEQSSNKWETLSDADLSEEAKRVMEQGTDIEISSDRFTVGNISIMTLSRAIVDEAGKTIGAMFFHTDMSRTNDSIKQVSLDVLLSACVAVILAFLAVTYITGRMTKPIVDMNNAINRFSRGDYEARVSITSRDEVGQLGQSFNDMANEINALEQSRRSFVANVSHELRSPLTSMRGFLEAMQDGTIAPEDQPKYLDIVIGECKRMTGMVNDLLDLARIESGQYELKLEPFDLNELVIRTLLTFEARINAKHIDVAMDFAAEHTIVEADQSQIAQVIRNLVDNAIKFSPDGGKLTVKIATDKKLAVISVIDEGDGISPEDLPYVFDRFYKAEKAHTPSGSSSGLGLSIVKRIIEQHGQTITASSPPGEGATFTLTLKLYEQQGKPKASPSQRR